MTKQWTGHEKIKAGTAIGVITAIVLSFVFSIINTQNFDSRSQAVYPDKCQDNGNICVLHSGLCLSGVMTSDICPSGTVCCLQPSPTPVCSTANVCKTGSPCTSFGLDGIEYCVNGKWTCITNYCSIPGSYDSSGCPGLDCRRRCEPLYSTQCTNVGKWGACQGVCSSPTPEPTCQACSIQSCGESSTYGSYCDAFGFKVNLGFCSELCSNKGDIRHCISYTCTTPDCGQTCSQYSTCENFFFWSQCYSGVITTPLPTKISATPIIFSTITPKPTENPDDIYCSQFNTKLPRLTLKRCSEHPDRCAYFSCTGKCKSKSTSIYIECGIQS